MGASRGRKLRAGLHVTSSFGEPPRLPQSRAEVRPRLRSPESCHELLDSSLGQSIHANGDSGIGFPEGRAGPDKRKKQQNSRTEILGDNLRERRDWLRSQCQPGFYTCESNKRKFRVLHLLGACCNVPGVDHFTFEHVGLDVPHESTYDNTCALCSRKGLLLLPQNPTVLRAHPRLSQRTDTSIPRLGYFVSLADGPEQFVKT